MSEDGFYFVDLGDGAGWRVAELENGKWWLVGSADSWTKGDFVTVGPKIPPAALSGSTP